ncbi:VanZ family protein [Lutibacter citreus]|uniref:VanZ family protein n=1 Tax=Lutibacter citreus TaxID=2138210 RepID=UPI000DBE0C06
MERKFYFFGAIILTFLIGWGSLISAGSSLPERIHVSDKLIHLTAYFLLNLFFLLVFKRKGKKLKVTLLISGLVLLYGIIIEVIQYLFTVNRQFDLIDILANFIGVFTAFLIFNYILQKKVFK